jgi:hypothetical protein
MLGKYELDVLFSISRVRADNAKVVIGSISTAFSANSRLLERRFLGSIEQGAGF